MAEEKEMSFLGHIGELRAHLIRSIIAIIIGALIIGFNINWIMDHIFFGPTRNDFLTFRVVNHFSREIIGHDSIHLPKDFPVRVQKLFQQFKISDIIVPLYDLSDYTTLFLQVVLGMGVIFLFPMVVYLLTSIGILTPQFLKTYRRHAIVVIMVVAAIITPADVLSMMAAAMPLVVLYEMSIWMSIYVHRKLEKQEKALAKANKN